MLVTNWLQTSGVYRAFSQRLEYLLPEGPPLSEKDAEELREAYEILQRLKPA